MFFFGDLNVLEHRNLKSTDKLVYFCLTSFFNRKTLVCYPRVSTIAERLNISKLRVYRAISRLKKAGLICVVRKQSTNEYKMPNLEKLLTDPRVRLIKNDNSDLSKMTSINKTKLYNQYTGYKRNYVNKYNFSNNPPLQTENRDITYEGASLKYTGTEGLLDEYRDKEGNTYTKDKITGEVKKKLKIIAHARLNTKNYKNL